MNIYVCRWPDDNISFVHAPSLTCAMGRLEELGDIQQCKILETNGLVFHFMQHKSTNQIFSDDNFELVQVENRGRGAYDSRVKQTKKEFEGILLTVCQWIGREPERRRKRRSKRGAKDNVDTVEGIPYDSIRQKMLDDVFNAPRPKCLLAKSDL